MKVIKIGLCEGRHNIDGVTEYIFPADFFKTGRDMFDFGRMRSQIEKTFANIAKDDFIDIYVTGYTPALVEVIDYIFHYGYHNAVFMHYNRDTNSYETQKLSQYYT